MTSRLALLLAAGGATLALSACESTQDKSKRLGEQAKHATHTDRGVKVTKLNPDVKVLGTTVLTDQNGSAVAVRLRNTGRRPLVRVPIGVDVLDAKGQSVFTNSIPGLEPNLTSTAVLVPGRETYWVNDQVTAAGKPAHVRAKAGIQSKVAKSLPALVVKPPRLKQDPVDGVYATGFVFNRSKVEQRHLVLYCVALKGTKVVAAGRGAIERLRVGRKQRYRIFFIGNPKGARLVVTAPPTVL